MMTNVIISNLIKITYLFQSCNCFLKMFKISLFLLININLVFLKNISNSKLINFLKIFD